MQKIASSSASPKAMSVNIHSNLMSLLSHSHAIEYTLLFLLKNLKAMGVGMGFWQRKSRGTQPLKGVSWLMP